MTSRERLAATLNHSEPDRLCVDFGAGIQSLAGAPGCARYLGIVRGNLGS